MNYRTKYKPPPEGGIKGKYMSNFMCMLLFIVFAIIGIVINVLLRDNAKGHKLWIILYVIVIIVVAGLSVPVLAMFMSNDFLGSRHHYVSGNSLDGYEAMFWLMLIVYGYGSDFIGAKITGTKFPRD
jgi:hypothetical protein